MSMIQTMKRLCLLTVLMSLCISIFADEFEVNGIKYRTTSSSTVEVSSKRPNYSGDIIIPESVVFQGKTYSVTSIEWYAFQDCRGLTSVTIPNSVTSIGCGAFFDCYGLTSVNISDIAAWCNIEFACIDSNPLYFAHHLYMNGEEITNVIIPNGVTSIGNWAFYGCRGLTSVTIPNSVTSIGYEAFKKCNSFTFRIESSTPIELDGPIFNNYSNINPHDCVSLEVPIGSTVAYANANYWNEAMKIYAKNKGKYYYPILPIITHIGETILSIDGLSGEGMELSEDDDVTVQVSKNDDFPYSMVMKGDCEITDFFTNGTYNYKPVAYYRQNVLSTYSYPYKDIRLPESGTLIDQIGIENIDEMDCLKVSGDINGTDILTIRKMKNLKLLDLSDAHIVNGGMSYYENYTTSNNTIGAHFYDGLNELLRITLPNDIHTIIRDAFNNNWNVRAIRMPSSIKDVSYSSMVYNFGRPLSLQIEDLEKWCQANFTYGGAINPYFIRVRLFLKDEEIYDLKIPEGITTIPWFIFNGCQWLNSINLPSSIKEIGQYSFTYCDNLTSVTSLNTTPPQITSETFSQTTYENATLYVPKGSKTLYWLHPYWENFQNIVEIDEQPSNPVGDANGDSTVNAADIVEVVNYIMGNPSSDFNENAADVNGDGVVNAADIVAMVNIIMEAQSRGN